MPNSYRTVSGDTWDSIAFSQLGGCEHTAALMKANLSAIGTTIFSAGIVLTLPEVSNTATAQLPPWRR
ncbi:tail protein X [Pectinatus frisingensis]|uniref:tail protein X n=1 Tax=Pectinatus frisingensis TaxID=865 RepID=UPI0018C54CE3